MDHRNVHGKIQPDHNEPHHNLSHTNGMQQFWHHGGVGMSDPNHGHAVENMPINQGHMRPNWNHASRSNRYSSTQSNIGIQHHQPDIVSLHHPYPPLPECGYHPAFASQQYHSSSSVNDPPAFHGNSHSSNDFRVSGRWSYKRKSHGISFGGERENTGRYCGAGSSFSGSLQPEFVQGKTNLDTWPHWGHHAMTNSYGSDSRSIVDEGATTRNVRRRYGFDVEPNLTVSDSSLQFPRPVIYPNGHAVPPDSAHWTSSCVNPDWRHTHMPSPHGVMPVRVSMNSSQATNHHVGGSNATGIGRHHYDLSINMNPFHHRNPNDNLTSGQEVLSTCPQRCTELNWNAHNVYAAGPSHDLSAEIFSSRHPRPNHREAYPPSASNRGPRILHERYSFQPDGVGGPDGLSEGFMSLEQSAIHGFHNMFDQHSEMRLDVDSLTYEELLALGERIGNVCTGLSEDSLSKCLRETAHHFLLVNEEETCAICLEEYQDMDSIGTLRGCGHGYHNTCIKKWLSMKNSCPICKAPGLLDNNTIEEK